MPSATTSSANQDESTNSQKPANQTTPRTGLSSYRMLYRGSLALPDSEMLLDGIIFVMQIARNSPMSLINSPIPLGLESMRGRSLRLISTVSIKDIPVECFGDVSMYVHPDAFLTRSFFERTLCTEDPSAAFAPDSGFTYQRTSVAVRIGLGDGTGPDETDILVFGQLPTPAPDLSLPPSLSSSSNPNTSQNQKVPQIIQLLAGRIAPPATPQPQPQHKLPRPDDPLPRPHPLASLHLSPGRRGFKRKRSSNHPFGPFYSTSHAGLSAGPPSSGSSGSKGGDAGSAIMAALAQAQAQGERLKKQGKVVIDAPSAKGLSKRPTLFQHHQSAPSISNSTSTSTSVSRGQSVDRDGFLVPGVPVRTFPVRRYKDKGKSPLRMVGEAKAGVGVEMEGGREEESNMEGKNKTAIKKRTLAALEACGISKQHAQFRDMYGWIHRGVAFAVRGVIQDSKVDRDLLTKLIEVHLEMYMGGRGGRYQSQISSQSQSQGDPDAPTRSPSTAQLTPDTGEVNGLPFAHKQALSVEEEQNEDSCMDLTLGNLTLNSTRLDIPVSEVLFDNSSSPTANLE